MLPRVKKITVVIVLLSIMTIVSAGAHPAHMMNADSVPDDYQPPDQANQFGLVVHQKMENYIL